MFMALLLIASLLAQDTRSRAPAPVPTVDHVSPEVRAARHRIYANIETMPPLDPSKPPRIIFVDGPPLPELPVGMSQVIVIGRVMSISPWLTPGNKTIYSEYGVAVDSVLMNRSNWKQDTTLDVLQMGGTASLPNGGTVSVTTRGLGEQIETGHTYVFFLGYVPNAECFIFVKTWDVTDGHAVPIRGDDVGRARNNISTVNGLLLQELVARIQALVSANK